MEAHAVLGSDPIPVPLGFADELAGFCELFIRSAGIHSGLDGLMGLSDGLSGNALELERVVANRLNAGLEGLSALVMAFEAGLFRSLERVRGFVIQCDVYFWPFSLMYGIWQSTQVTPASAWTLVAHASKSGCCALSIGALESA